MSAVATVSDSGVVFAVTAGSTTIRAASGGQSADVSVSVRDGGYITPAGGVVDAAAGAVSLLVPAQAISADVALVEPRGTTR